jgi:hypothetical protein
VCRLGRITDYGGFSHEKISKIFFYTFTELALGRTMETEIALDWTGAQGPGAEKVERIDYR